MTALAINPISWADDGTSFKKDAVFFALALLLHAPLLTIRVNVTKKQVLGPTERLVSVDLIDPAVPKKPPPPPPKVKKKSLFSKLKALVKKAPPPPKPVKKVAPPKKLALASKQIKLQPKLKTPDQLAPRLKSKAGFKTKANANLVKEKKISLKSLGSGVAPLSAKKLGTVKNRSKIKSNRGNFKLAKADTLSGIGGKGPGVADPTAPTIAIKTGKRGSKEKFSAPAPQKLNKGSFSRGSSKGLGSNKKLGLRDSIIARDVSSAQIGSTSGSRRRTGGGGGGSGALATKKDAGRSFQVGKQAGVGAGALAGGGGGARSAKVQPIQQRIRKKKKKSFVITGELKNRKIIKRIIPTYPAWAQAKGIEAAVILEFTVIPKGIVKDSIVVRRTSGYPKLDKEAIKALLKWVFAPLPGNVNREEVGMITFNFSLT